MKDKDSLQPSLWEGRLRTRRLGRGEVIYASVMDSTNARARDMVRAGAPHGSIALCEEQTAGHGRLGRSWQCPQGEALMHSLLLRPSVEAERAQLFTLAAAVAAAEAARELRPTLEPLIKWPNDLVLDGKKCAGILCELISGADGIAVIVGVGINVNQTRFEGELADKATSLCAHAGGKPLDRAELLCMYLKHMEDAVEAIERYGLQGIRERYMALSATVGSRVRVLGAGGEFTGTARDIDDTGALLVVRENGAEERVMSGDVSVRGIMGYI